MKKVSKMMSVFLATAVVVTPYVSAPQAYAITNVSVDADDDEAGEETEYTIKFKLEEDFSAGDNIYVDFDSDFEIDEDLDESNVDVEGKEPSSVDVNGNTVEIEVDEDYDSGDKIEVTIDGITNPDDEDEYEITVWTDADDDSESDTIDIGDNDDDDDDDKDTVKDAFTVEPDLTYEAQKTGYEIKKFSLHKKSEDLEQGKEITVTFPSKSMLPTKSYEKDEVEINGREVDNVTISGSKVTLTIPKKADGDDDLKIEFLKDFGLKNPSPDDDYIITVKYDGYEYKSKPFEIKKSETSTNFPVTLSNSKAGARSSYTFEASYGTAELKGGQQVKIVFPSSSMVPSDLSKSDITINGKKVRATKVSGATVTLTTSTTMPASRSVKVAFAYAAELTNPKSAGSYQLKMTVGSKTITSKAFTINQ